MSRFPVLVDMDALLARLTREEGELMRTLASLEERIRQFEGVERPAFDEWLRIELGPRFSAFEELIEQLRLKEFLARRTAELVNQEGYHPREALYLATAQVEPTASQEGAQDFHESEADPVGSGPKRSGQSSWDPDEVEARRSAKREAKRDARRSAKREARGRQGADGANGAHGASSALGASAESARRKLVAVYRSLARRLHPDSPVAIGGDRGRKLWLEVQVAYEAGQLERLLAVAAWIEEAAPAGVGEPLSSGRKPGASFSERYERLRSFRKAHAKLQGDLELFSTHPAWGFGSARGSDRRKLLKRAARELDEEMARAQNAFAELDDFLTTIGKPRAPKRR
jgi:hypothetical protein